MIGLGNVSDMTYFIYTSLFEWDVKPQLSQSISSVLVWTEHAVGATPHVDRATRSAAERT